MAIITVANQKGGVGKTTTAVTLAAGLAQDHGLEVLIIDLDTQGNVSDSLRIEKSGALLEWLLLEKKLTDVVINARKRLDVVRSDKTTVKLKISLAGMEFRESVLSNALKGYENYYDLVVIDCAPSVDVLHTASMVAADLLIIPTRLDQFSIEGVVETLRSLATVQQITKSRCELAGIIPTFYDRVTNESHEQLKALARAYTKFVWPPIPQSAMCRSASRMGRTVWEFNPKSNVADGYRECLKRLLKLL